MSLSGNASANNVLIGNVQGLNSIHGKSAYELAVIHGFEGTEEEWIASLKGEKGDAYILTEADKEEIADKVAVDNLEESAEKYIDSVIEEKDLEVTATATGSAITIDSANAPLQNLKLFGKTEQNGTPTPSAPVPLVSVGDSGSFEVGVYGGNLWKTPPSNTATGVVGVANADGSYTLNGTAGNSYFVAVSTEFVLPKGTYRHACDKPTGTESVMCFVRKKGDSNVISGNFTLAETTVMTAFIQVPPNATVNGTIYPKITIGTTVKPFELCKAKQTLTMPYTLRSVGDIKDEVDFNRGVYGKKLELATITTVRGVTELTNCVRVQVQVPYTVKSYIALCSHFVRLVDHTADNEHFYCGLDSDNAFLFINKSRLSAYDKDTIQSWIVAQGIKILFQPTPIETPLTETELNAYRHLMTNKGTTTILSEAEAEVDYYINKPNAQAIGNIHTQVNADYFKLQHAIISTGGN